MANITFLEAGGASTGGTELWDFASSPSGASQITVDTTTKPPGAYSSFNLHASGNIAQNMRVDNVFAGGSTGRVSFYYRSSVAANQSVCGVRTSGDAVIGGVDLSSGKLVWADGNGNPSASGSTTLSPNTFYRISFGFNLHAADNLDVKVYLNGSLELNLTGKNTGGNTGPDRFRIISSGNDNDTFFAHFYIDDGSDLSDPGNYQCTAKFPSTVNANNFDTTGGTGAVNERPLNEANYKEQAGASQVSQDYNLQAINEGDVNLTGLTQVGYMGWIWAKESAVSGTPQITLNGTSYAITLTTSPAIYRKPITSAAYPSNAAAIGMVSSGTADDTFLYECGVVVAFLAPEQVKLATLAFAGR